MSGLGREVEHQEMTCRISVGGVAQIRGTVTMVLGGLGSLLVVTRFLVEPTAACRVDPGWNGLKGSACVHMALRRQAGVSYRSTSTKLWKTDPRLARHSHLAPAGHPSASATPKLVERSCRHLRGVKVAGFGDLAEIESMSFSFGVR